jgi:hypothetical protein
LLIVAPVFYGLFYPHPYLGQLVRKIPVAAVDDDRTRYPLVVLAVVLVPVVKSGSEAAKDYAVCEGPTTGRDLTIREKPSLPAGAGMTWRCCVCR